MNAAWGTNHRHWAEIQFSHTPPDEPARRADWARYVTTRMAASGVTLENPPSDAEFRDWLQHKYGSLDRLNRALRTHFTSLDEISFPPTLPDNKRLRADWAAFAAERVPAERWRFRHPCHAYHQFLRDRYGSIENLSAAYGQPYASFDEVRLPQAAFDRAEFFQRKGRLIRFFLTDNFIQVFKYIAVQGRALWNTLILVGASLAAALTLNPMAAYALSRFKIKNKQAILICFLLPMAFPGEVASIPAFILTHDRREHPGSTAP